MRAVDGNGKSRSTGQCAGYQPYHAWRVDAERILQPCRRQSGGTNNQQGDDNECLPFAPEGIEEARTGLYADGEYE